MEYYKQNAMIKHNFEMDHLNKVLTSEALNFIDNIKAVCDGDVVAIDIEALPSPFFIYKLNRAGFRVS
jgi:hypothetical protein